MATPGGTALVDAVQTVTMSRRAMTEAAHRRAAAVTSARHAIEAAEAAERAEQAAALSTAQAGLRRLAAQGLTPTMIGRLCSIPAETYEQRMISMTTTQESAVLSEDNYTVVEVAGHAPGGLDDVVGATTVTVTRDGRDYRLIGTGARTAAAVHFYQKEIGSAGEEVLVWTILDRGNGRLVAEPPLSAL